MSAEIADRSQERRMDLEKLYEILGETTVSLRKGEEIEERRVGNVQVTEVFAMPHESQAPQGLEKVDVVFMTIGVNKQQAEARKEELTDILNNYPEPERLAGGPSYIEVGAAIGSQEAAFQLFAVGKVLGFWDVITPETMGISGSQARELAGGGMIMISGYRKPLA